MKKTIEDEIYEKYALFADGELTEFQIEWWFKRWKSQGISSEFIDSVILSRERQKTWHTIKWCAIAVFIVFVWSKIILAMYG